MGGVLARTLGKDACLPANAHFFRVGGHSLLAVQALDQISLELGTHVPLALIFEHPVVADLAAAIHSHDEGARSTIVRQPRVPHPYPVDH